MRPPRGLWLLLLVAPAILWLGCLVVLPHVEIAILSVSERVAPRVYAFGFANYREFFLEPLYWRTFARTAVLSILVTALTLGLAFPVALFIARAARGRTKSILFLLCLIPFWVSELVRTLGWMILLRETGVVSAFLQKLGLASGPVELLYNDGAVVLGLVYGGLLFMVVPLVNALDSLDPSLVEAGYDLGGSRATVLSRIVIPHAMPGIVAGCVVVFMLTVGNFATPGAPRRQERAVVHRADLCPVHHPLQLAPRLGLRLPPACALLGDRLGGIEAVRPVARADVAARVMR